MNVAAAVMDCSQGGLQKQTRERQAHKWLRACRAQQVDLVVFPALFGMAETDGNFLEAARRWSHIYPELVICPGSWWEEQDGKRYHTACLLHDGEVLLAQRQLYLAKWEQRAGLARGTEVPTAEWRGFRIGILLSTDIFYPQVARHLAMRGADLVLSPLALAGGGGFAAQCAGVWQNVQQNVFFAVESGFKGVFRGTAFSSESLIHAPLAVTARGDGILARETKDLLVTAKVDLRQKKEAEAAFNPLTQLNPAFYDDQLFRRHHA